MAGWSTGCGVDVVAFATAGVYSSYYGAGEAANLANLYATLGLLEDLPAPPEPSPSSGGMMKFLFKFLFN
jgi:hypothetical protein